MLYNKNYIKAEVYPSFDLTGSIICKHIVINFIATQYISTINYNWGNGNVLGTGYSDFVSIRFTSYLRPPLSTTYYFHVDSDDGANVYIGSSYLSSQKTLTCICSNDFSANLNANTDYYFMLEYGEYNGGALVDTVFWIISLVYNCQTYI